MLKTIYTYRATELKNVHENRGRIVVQFVCVSVACLYVYVYVFKGEGDRGEIADN